MKNSPQILRFHQHSWHPLVIQHSCVSYYFWQMPTVRESNLGFWDLFLMMSPACCFAILHCYNNMLRPFPWEMSPASSNANPARNNSRTYRHTRNLSALCFGFFHPSRSKAQTPILVSGTQKNQPPFDAIKIFKLQVGANEANITLSWLLSRFRCFAHGLFGVSFRWVRDCHHQEMKLIQNVHRGRKVV